MSSPPPPTTETPLAQLTARLPQLVQETGHGEMWGVELAEGPERAPAQVVLRKFLRANGGSVDGAEKQLRAALEWRKAVRPDALLDGPPFDGRRFGGLGFVTVHGGVDGGEQTVVTWNIYGAVKNNKATFGQVKDFIQWRAALMELGVRKLRLNDITEPPAESDEDPHQMIQVHDYRSVSFFRMDPDVKAASRETIQTLSMAYPELLAHKYFVNVPAIMGWVFGAMKLFLSPATLRKFHPMASGASLAAELGAVGPDLPPEYGGQGPALLQAASTVPLTGVDDDATGKDATGSDVVEEQSAGDDVKEKSVGKDDAPAAVPPPAAAADFADAPAAAAAAATAPAESKKGEDKQVEVAADKETKQSGEPATEAAPAKEVTQ
ncbi:hypothetical protein CDD83_3217 [Cordyceps sp. RAO-2017]|nr:hypothetical protein CDD83_3217 [Cordyceps sp. RAO-2017]